jgi:serine-type D-Ala-D-Ala endopeptidase (penicillin-binding protein 7)
MTVFATLPRMNPGKLKTILTIASLLGMLGCGWSAAANATTTHHSRHRRHAADPVPSADDPGLKSAAAYVIDQGDSSVWYSHNAGVASPIASITKLMTALVVADAHLPMDEMLRVTAEDRGVGTTAASRLAVGTELTRGELLHLALMSSENRAAHALGRNYPGGVTAFVRAMNEKAQSLGMTSSHFVEPTGLSSDNVASPEDLSRLVMAAAQNPTIRDFSTDTEHTVRIGRRLVEFHNTDALTRNPGWDIIVQKTGYITAAGRCLVMQAVIGGRDVVIVLLNSFGKYTRVADAVRVRKWVEARMSEHSAHTAVSTNS